MKSTNILNLKLISLSQVRQEALQLMIKGNSQQVAAFQTVSDQVIFTKNKVFVINVQGIKGKNPFSYPYSNIQSFGVETADVLDIDRELVLAFSDSSKLSFYLKSNVDV